MSPSALQPSSHIICQPMCESFSMLRNQVKAEMEKGSTVNITLNDMICFAVIRALEKFPEANSHFLGDSTT